MTTSTEIYDGLDREETLALARSIVAQGDEAGFDAAAIEDARLRLLPYDVPALRPGVVVLLTDRTRVPAETRSFLARITTVERREGSDHFYVGWQQPGAGYGFQQNAGSWGLTHVYPDGPREWGTIGVEVVTALPREIAAYEDRARALARRAGEDESAWIAGSPVRS